MSNSSYGQILVTVKDHHTIDAMISELRADLPARFPDAIIILKKFRRGPGNGEQIQARFNGPDTAVLRHLAREAEGRMAANIDVEIRAGKAPYSAVIDSMVSRLRPVSMASLTTVLGMLPLLQDVFFVGMSITIIGGLTFGTILTLVVVPVLYALFFKICKI
jgi:multidrug efflux pump subunit AcrB